MSDKVTTPLFRADFVSLLDPKKKKPEDEDKSDVWEVTMIFEPEVANTPAFKALERIIQQAIEEKWGNKPPSYIKMPFRKGVAKSQQYPQGYDLSKYPQYEGKIITAARSYSIPPGVCDANLQPILDKSQIYSGMYGRATVVAYGYDNKGGQGVTFGLQNFQKCMDGEPLGGARVAAEMDFEAFEVPGGASLDSFGVFNQQPAVNPLASLGI